MDDLSAKFLEEHRPEHSRKKVAEYDVSYSSVKNAAARLANGSRNRLRSISPGVYYLGAGRPRTRQRSARSADGSPPGGPMGP
jgi:hypothetical protein